VSYVLCKSGKCQVPHSEVFVDACQKFPAAFERSLQAMTSLSGNYHLGKYSTL
jgi:hypothetical protein